MKSKLTDEDRRALNLILDRGNAAATSGPLYAAADEPMSKLSKRIPKIQKVLQLLDALPAEEPPQDLVARTLKYIAAAPGHREPRHANPIAGIVADQSQPA
jgi:hypothetical protein